MPAAPIGSSWASGSWTDTSWEAGTWADIGSNPIAAVFGDLTTLFRGYVDDLRDANPTEDDSNTVTVNDQDDMWGRVGHGADLNTDYARDLS